MKGLLIASLGAVALAGVAVVSFAQDEAPFADAIAAFKTADAEHMPEACRNLFVGSSSIRIWDTLAADMAPRPVIQRGFGGSQMSQLNHYFDDIVAPYHPRAIVVYEGDNDIALGKTPEQVAADVAAFMDMKTAALGPTPVYFLAIKVSKLRFDELPEQQRANALVAAMADARDDLTFVDVASPLLDADGEPRDVFRADDLHMTAEGYAIWTPIIAAALDAPAPTTAPGC